MTTTETYTTEEYAIADHLLGPYGLVVDDDDYRVVVVYDHLKKYGHTEEDIKTVLDELARKGIITRSPIAIQCDWVIPEGTNPLDMYVEFDKSQAVVDELQTQLTAARERVKEVAQEAAKMRDTLTAQIAEAREQAGRIVEVVVKKGPRKKTSVKEYFHADLEYVLPLAQLRSDFFLWGPTGCGKTTICEQVARCVDLRFAAMSCTSGMSESELVGRLLPMGKNGAMQYVPTEFVDFYENGGLFLLDEVDAADANVMLKINSAIANGYMMLDKRLDNPIAKRHPDFVIAASANTVGTGGTKQYSGRNKLDHATLDRFTVNKILMGYDKTLESQLCVDAEGNELTDLLRLCWGIREAIVANDLERSLSTRTIVQAARLINETDMTVEKMFCHRTHGYFSGWRKDERRKVITYVKQECGITLTDDVK